MLTDFQNSFTDRLSSRFLTKQLLLTVFLPHLKCVATPLNAVFTDIYVSQGSVAMHLRYGGIFYYGFAGNLLLSLTVKEF